MSSTLGIRDDRPHDGGPAADISGSVYVGTGNVSTPLADELVLRSPVGLLAMPTPFAGLRGISRIHANERDPRETGFVFEETTKLPERPLAVPTTLRFAKPLAASFADALQILKGYPSVGLFRFVHDAPAKDVVRVLLKASLASRELFEMTPRGLPALRRSCGIRRLLQLASDALVSFTRLLDLLSGVCFAVGVRRQRHYAQIDSEPVFGSPRRRLFDLDSGEQIPFAFPVDKIRFTFARGEQGASPFVANKRDALARLGGSARFAGNGPDGYLVSFAVPTEDAVVISDSPERTEEPPCPLIELIGIRDLREQSYDDLSGQPKTRLDILIDRLLELILAEGPSLPRHLRHVVAGFVDAAKRGLKSAGLRPRWGQLDHDRKSHAITMLMRMLDHEWILNG